MVDALQVLAVDPEHPVAVRVVGHRPAVGRKVARVVRMYASVVSAAWKPVASSRDVASIALFERLPCRPDASPDTPRSR